MRWEFFSGKCENHSHSKTERKQLAFVKHYAFLSVEFPAVFAVLFEAAKAKSALCDNRVRLSKNAERFCV
jgi:hypothetical protein